jgi:nucleolar complex protein 3
MLEEDNDGYGMNAYNENVEDPQATNAINSSVAGDLNLIV